MPHPATPRRAQKLETDALRECWTTPEHHEAIDAFLNKRIPIFLHWQEKAAFKETYAGALDTVVVEGQYLKPREATSKTIAIFMHPTGTMNLLPMPNALAAAGVPCLTCGSRYPHNDSALIMKKVILDLGRYIRYAREKLGFEKVILAGWSGGGSLLMFYQSQAEKPWITATPAGDPVDVVGAKLPKADAVLQLAAHVSRAITLTEWLDLSIRDELNPDDRIVELDLYDPNWLSQWSYAESRADGPKCAADVSVPVLVVQNSADDGCASSHAARLFAGVQHDDKEFHEMKGAMHYYIGQPDKMAEAVAIVKNWLERKGFLV